MYHWRQSAVHGGRCYQEDQLPGTLLRRGSLVQPLHVRQDIRLLAGQGENDQWPISVCLGRCGRVRSIPSSVVQFEMEVSLDRPLVFRPQT